MKTTNNIKKKEPLGQNQEESPQVNFFSLRKLLINAISFYFQRVYHIWIGVKLIKCVPALD